MKKRIFLLLFLVFALYVKAQYISVDESFTAEQLVQDVLFSNGCANVSNISVSGGNFASGEKSWGYFSANSSSFPIEDGIILSTGKIENAVGPNTSLSDDTVSGWGGDSDLNQALGISNSINATILEFDFVPTGNIVSFDYIFASEEYHGTAACQYSDGFAFLLQEVGTGSYQNLALIPGTSIPVKVTTVHPAIIGGCSEQNDQYFGTYNDTSSPINYNGQTVVLNAQANVVAGTTYHIKLVIADEGNYRYDSAIFLKGGSFSFDNGLGNDRSFANGNPVCYDESVTLDASNFGGTTYQWYFEGNALAGETNATFLLNPPYTQLDNGRYKVILDIGTACERSEDVYLDFAQTLQVNSSIFVKCDDDNVQNGISYFKNSDLLAIKNNLFANLPSNYIVELFTSPTSTEPIVIPYYNSTAYLETIFAKVINVNCYIVPITLIINTFEEKYPDQSVTICNNTSATLQAPLGYNYLWSTGATSSSITANLSGNYTVKIINTEECSTTKKFIVTNSEKATIQSIKINDFSEINSAEIIVTGNGSYEYSIDGEAFQTSNYFSGLEEGLHTVIVTDTNGCGSVSEEFYILDYPRYFTPNGDGINDYWNIKNLEKRGLNASKIAIFDRYGKLLYQILPNKLGWDGNLNNRQLPASDYWFVLELTDGKTLKGHFSLIR